MQSAVTTKGQVTLPKAVRERLHLSPGDRVKFFVDADGRVYLLPTLPISSLRGILAHRVTKPLSIEEIEEGIGQGAVEDYEASLQS